MLRRILLPVLLVPALVCLGGPADSAGPVRVAAAASDPTPIDAAPINYVALGDSYSAGPLIPTTRTDPVGCLRSTNNYPAFLAGYLGVATYRDMTCSGARTGDLFARQAVVFGDRPAAQLVRLSADTDVVTLGIGGNDYGLFGSMISTCEFVRAQDPTGNPCQEHFTNRLGVDTKKRDARRIQRHVGHALAAIHRRAPDAAVFVMGYPRLLPVTGTCAAVPFASGDYPWARQVEGLLNRSLRRAAADNHATYLDLYPHFRGHDACAGDAAWINGSKLVAGVAANYHPFQVGEREMGRVAYHQMTGLSAPQDPQAAPPPGSVIPNPPVTP